MNKTLRAFHGDPSIKARYVARMKAHIAADELIKGIYAEGDPKSGTFKACAVGCTLHSGNHAAAETEIGFPQILMHLEDSIFEGLALEDGQNFALEFLECVPVGADLTLVAARWLHWLLVDKKDGVIRFAGEREKSAILDVGALYARRINGDEPTHNEWEAADAVAYAARVASDAAYAAHAARVAADAAYAAHAAHAAYAAAEVDAARSQQDKKLIELMKNAPCAQMTT